MKYLLEYRNIKQDIYFQDNIKVRILEKNGGEHLIEEIGSNNIYTNDIRLIGYKDEMINIGFFNIQKYGRIYLNPNPIVKSENYLDNSFFLWGGFEIREGYRKMGFGKKVIKKLFELIRFTFYPQFSTLLNGSLIQ